MPLIQETWSQAKSELVRNKERGLDKSTKKAVLTKQNFLLSSIKTDTIFEITVSVMIIQRIKILRKPVVQLWYRTTVVSSR